MKDGDFNFEHLNISRFLQDEQQKQIKVFDIQEYDKILELAKLYSLNIQTENGCIILNKTRLVVEKTNCVIS